MTRPLSTLSLLLCLPLSLSSATLGPVVVTAPRGSR